jgi:hypothetical protein
MKGQSDWSSVAEKWHNSLRVIVANHRNDEMRTAEINRLLEKIPGVGNNAQFIQPSDHCLNVTNEGACSCAKTDRSLFEQIRRGVYRIR